MEDEFVVCPSCGTRIKAGREFCLRCYEPLPTPDRPAKPPVWESLGLSDTKKQIVVGVLAAAALALGVVIYMTEPPAVDETARPATARSTARPATAAPAATAAAPPTAAAGSTDSTGGPIYVPLQTPTGPPMTSEDVAKLEAKRTTLEAELAQSPDDVGLLNDVAVALDQLGRPADAIARFERAVALAPDQARLHMNFAHALRAAGLWDRAVAELREAARLRPTDFLSQYTLAQTLHQKGDDQGAVAEFEKAVKLGPNEASARLLYGVSLETLGRRDDAVREFKRFLVLQPSSAESERLREHLRQVGVEQP